MLFLHHLVLRHHNRHLLVVLHQVFQFSYRSRYRHLPLLLENKEEAPAEPIVKHAVIRSGKDLSIIPNT